MKKATLLILTLFVAGLAFLFSACSKSSGSTKITGTTDTINHYPLLGSWEAFSEIDTTIDSATSLTPVVTITNYTHGHAPIQTYDSINITIVQYNLSPPQTSTSSYTTTPFTDSTGILSAFGFSGNYLISSGDTLSLITVQQSPGVYDKGVDRYVKQ
jgi:hypothetical protein